MAQKLAIMNQFGQLKWEVTKPFPVNRYDLNQVSERIPVNGCHLLCVHTTIQQQRLQKSIYPYK